SLVLPRGLPPHFPGDQSKGSPQREVQEMGTMLRRTRVLADDRVAEGEVVRSGVAVERPPFSPAQLIALAIGIFFTVVSGAAIARTGIDANNMNVHVTGPLWNHTTWTGIGELAFGLFMIGAGVVPGAGRGMMTFLGMVAVGIGILLDRKSTRLNSSHQIISYA